MPIAATSRARTPALARASCATPIWVLQISPRVVFDPTAFGKKLLELFLSDPANMSFVVEQNRAAARRALVEGQNILHVCLLY